MLTSNFFIVSTNNFNRYKNSLLLLLSIAINNRHKNKYFLYQLLKMINIKNKYFQFHLRSNSICCNTIDTKYQKSGAQNRIAWRVEWKFGGQDVWARIKNIKFGGAWDSNKKSHATQTSTKISLFVLILVLISNSVARETQIKNLT
jgi:hypothetical protein